MILLGFRPQWRGQTMGTFKVIFNEVPIQQFYALPYDRWEGYEAERKDLLRFLKNKVDNSVFLTTDVHANMVNDARFNTSAAPASRTPGSSTSPTARWLGMMRWRRIG